MSYVLMFVCDVAGFQQHSGKAESECLLTATKVYGTMCFFTQRRRGFKQHPSNARSGCLITATKVYVILWDVARMLASNLNVSQVYDDAHHHQWGQLVLH